MQQIPPTSWVNGVAEGQISIFDRGLMYGQSLFETMVCEQQGVLLFEAHLDRLQRGCNTLGIDLNITLLKDEISAAAEHVSNTAVLRASVTMGEGGRGYKNPDQPKPNRIVSLHEYPDYPTAYYHDGIELGVADMRLAAQPYLAGLKHGNRLEQLIARAQWQVDWQEALLLDMQDNLIEATQSNVFIVVDGELLTPDLSQSGVAGVMRNFILQNSKEIGVDCRIVPLSIADIESADEVIVCNSVIGLWPVKQFQQTAFGDFQISQKLLILMQDHGAIPNI
ncbi:MAG: aminodeoxychorismate lyase [Acidiferrobacterales bacterium]|nr:aminodeoxychorismate lyase [Acidiferrobacterales bacterium]